MIREITKNGNFNQKFLRLHAIKIEDNINKDGKY